MPPSTVARLGESIVQDESLSGSRRMSCQTCHQPATGHASIQLRSRYVFDDVERAYAFITMALAPYQREDAECAAFSSKHDAYPAGRAQLTGQEARGRARFEDVTKGNCTVTTSAGVSRGSAACR